MQRLQLPKIKRLGCCSIAKHKHDGVLCRTSALSFPEQVRYPVTFLGALPTPLLLL